MDLGTREVFRSGSLAAVSPKAFQLLEILIDRRPNAVSKHDLHRLLWPETFVSDANLPNLVRELRNALERAAVLSRSDIIGRDDLPDAMFRETVETITDAHHASSLEEMEREHIRRVLSETATLDEAAATLGINVTTLWRKRKRYGIE